MRLNFTRRLLCTAASPFLMLLLSFLVTAPAFAADPPIPSGDIRIHYHRPDATYTGWTIYAFDNTTEDTSNYCDNSVPVTGTDTYGAYFDVGVTSGAQEVGLIIHKPTPGCSAGDVKDPGPNEFVNPSTMGNEYWAYSGIGKLYNEAHRRQQSQRAAARIRPHSLLPPRRQLLQLVRLRLRRHC